MIRAEQEITLLRVDDGEEGFSPIANVTKVGDTATITITDKLGTTQESVSDGSDAPSITDVTTQYYLSTSDIELSGGSWEDTPQEFISTSTPVYNRGLTYANEYALSANEAADSANRYANQALNSLSEVEKVVDVLAWITEHGEYAPAEEAAVEVGKFYFEPIEPEAEEAFSALTDESDVELTDENNNNIIIFEQYQFVVVTPEGDEDPLELGWYELISVDDAISNYVSSHLALDASGLWLQTDGVGSKVLLSALEGLVIYGSNGLPMAKYGESAIIGDENGFHIEISDTEIGFYQVAQKVAYINGNRLYITQSVVLQQIDIGTPVADGGKGQWSWCVHLVNNKNNLCLKWLG